MTENEAYAILHPDTTRDKLAEIEYYAGFKGEEAKNKAVEEACIVACEAMVELGLYASIGTIEEFKALKEKNEPKKPIHNGANWYRCNNGCEVHKKAFEKDWYCPKCGQKLDWQ